LGSSQVGNALDRMWTLHCFGIDGYVRFGS
jgi:hypothetical protein